MRAHAWKSRLVRRTALVAVVAWCVFAGYRVWAQRQNDAADVARLVEVLNLGVGSAVADIGAGSGELTAAIAERVGPTGHVYSTEINPSRLKELRTAAEKAPQHNITVVEGASAETNLPPNCCDGVFMRNVYHHFGNAVAMNESIRKSLKPGGRVAVVDFRPDNSENAPAGRRDAGHSHGVMPDAVIKELTQAGFTHVEQLPWSSSRGFLIVGEAR